MNKILKILGIICIIVIISISIFKIIKNNENIIAKIPTRILVIKSGSMMPTLKVGDIIIIKKQEKYNVGDIVTFSHNKYLITHRIIGIDNNNDFITKGDNNNCEDLDRVTIKNVKGKVILVIDRTKRNFLLISIISFILVINFMKGKKDEQNN